MLINVDKTGTVEGFTAMLHEMVMHKETQGLLIFACDANNFTPEMLNPELKNVSIPLLGGIFPEVIAGKEKLRKGTIFVGLPVAPDVQIIPQLSDMTEEYENVLDEKIPEIGPVKTIFVLVDGLAKRISALIDSLFNVFGLEVNYIGGGAGSLSFEQKPCLLTNEGLLQDSALLALFEMESGIGVRHGWKSISGPFKVTEADRNVVKTLDWEPAFAVYRDVVEKASGKVFTSGNFFELAKGYPFGINRMGTEKIVRDPIMVDDNDTLICVGEVPEECYVDILSGDVFSLVNAAGEALQLAKEAFQGNPAAQTTLFIDCISRVLFLEEEFHQELHAVCEEDRPVFGALTLGEIANSGKEYLEFYNKTAVVAVLEG